jgi:hypothetical protein
MFDATQSAAEEQRIKAEQRRLAAERGYPFWQKTYEIEPLILGGKRYAREVYIPKPGDMDYEESTAALYTDEMRDMVGYTTYFYDNSNLPLDYDESLLKRNREGSPSLVGRWDHDLDTCYRTEDGQIKPTRRLNSVQLAATFGWSEYQVRSRLVHVSNKVSGVGFRVQEYKALKAFQEFEKTRQAEESEKLSELEAKKQRKVEREKRQEEIEALKQKKLLRELEKEAERDRIEKEKATRKAIDEMLSKVDPEKVLKFVAEST